MNNFNIYLRRHSETVKEFLGTANGNYPYLITELSGPYEPDPEKITSLFESILKLIFNS